MNVAADDDGVGLHRQRGAQRADVVVAVVGHDVVGGNESGHVASRFTGQVRVYLPIVLLAACTVDGLADVGRAAVVGGNDQIPVAENLVEVAQVVGGGIAGLDGVAALVDQRVHLQTVLLARSEHELPKTGSPHTRHGLRVEGRLDDGQVLQLQRQPVGLKGFLEDRHVEVAGSQHVADGVAQTAAVTLDELLHHLVVGHVHNGRQAAQTVNVHLAVEGGVLGCRAAVAVLTQIGLRHIEVHQRVQVVGHGLGEVDDLLVAFLVGHGDFILGHHLFLVFFFFIVIICIDNVLRQQGTG